MYIWMKEIVKPFEFPNFTACITSHTIVQTLSRTYSANQTEVPKIPSNFAFKDSYHWEKYTILRYFVVYWFWFKNQNKSCIYLDF